MKKIILVRHAEKAVIDGFTHIEADPVLTKKGRTQALEIKEFLKNEEYDIVLTSLFRRAVETAEIINEEKGKAIIKTISFNEYFLRPDGENVEGTRMGIARTMSKLYSLYDQYKTVLIVCHSSIGRSIIQSLLNLEYEEINNYFNHNGNVYVLRYDHDLGDKNWRVIDSFAPDQ